ncbi:MAG: glycosyltransferase [Bacteroidetes bacterium]|nr:MAG: glycosyltransferase [Bacteroidota bacterium]
MFQSCTIAAVQCQIEEMPVPKHILLAPLEWGLGHATRCIPIIDLLLARGMQVSIGGDGRSLALLSGEYPQLRFFELPAYGVRYSRGGGQVWAMLRQLPHLLKVMRQEQQVLQRLVETAGIEAVISDNRYGLWHTAIPSVFVCHQLAVQLPKAMQYLQPLLHRLHLRYIQRFDTCWIPDLPGVPNLAGALAHRPPLPAGSRFVGPLSRFQAMQPPEKFTFDALNGQEVELLAVLSGPEPQRSMLESMLLEQLRSLGRPCWIVQGRTEYQQLEQQGQVQLISYMNSQDLMLALKKARIVISRPGYSSLMDYAALGLRQVILIPTPGQTEQEYLGMRMQQAGTACCCSQASFHLPTAIKQLASMKGFRQLQASGLLEAAVDEWLSAL